MQLIIVRQRIYKTVFLCIKKLQIDAFLNLQSDPQSLNKPHFLQGCAQACKKYIVIENDLLDELTALRPFMSLLGNAYIHTCTLYIVQYYTIHGIMRLKLGFKLLVIVQLKKSKV